MIRIITTLLAAATIASLANPAAAQTRYFARERLTGMSSMPVGTWTSTTGAWSACKSGIKSRSVMSTCSGGNCDPSTKPAATENGSCLIGCGSFSSGDVQGGELLGSNFYGGNYETNGRGTCEAQLNGRAGICVLRGNGVYVYLGGTVIANATNTTARCNQ